MRGLVARNRVKGTSTTWYQSASGPTWMGWKSLEDEEDILCFPKSPLPLKYLMMPLMPFTNTLEKFRVTVDGLGRIVGMSPKCQLELN